MNKIKLHTGDSSKVLKKYPDNHFDSIVTDPPYGIEFLGKDWDNNTGPIEVWRECLRVLKPGGHLLAFSAARTYHRLASNIEDIGFEIRDQIMWIYGSGFPKGQDMGKLIEKRKNKDINLNPYIYHEEVEDDRSVKIGKIHNPPKCVECDQYVASPSNTCTKKCNAKFPPKLNEWSGWKTGLKPAHEPIVMARKPFKGSTVDNVLKNGVGAINVDDTRVEVTDIEYERNYKAYAKNLKEEHNTNSLFHKVVEKNGPAQGRYPSNVIMSEEEGKVLDSKTGLKPSHKPIVMARKPFKGSTVDNVIKNGVGAINIDDTRVEVTDTETFAGNSIGYKTVPEDKRSGDNIYGFKKQDADEPIQTPEGRYPANVIMSEEEGKVLDEKTSTGPKRKAKPVQIDQETNNSNAIAAFQASKRNISVSYNDGGSQAGGASKYFYCPKVSKKERNVGCEDLQPKETVQYNKGMEGKLRSDGTIIKEPIKQTNNHPTVKPVALMKYLVTLVTPKGGKVLDPFNGSGSTGMAVKEFGGEYVGIDLNKDYIKIAKKRIKAWEKK
jgi:DNA modification methylase